MPEFDLVVFDEASQIRPEEALCSIVRGRQLVVVGDTRQMPPTSFFDRVWADQEADEEDEDVLEGLQAMGLESILDLMSARANDPVRRPDLRWHYRSVHPSLIEPSNRHIYRGRLVVFPSPSRDCDGHRVGIVFHRVAGQYHPGARQRVNPKEAEEVLRAVREHLV
jgi:superfamily I DNA and/or RNA helicase